MAMLTASKSHVDYRTSILSLGLAYYYQLGEPSFKEEKTSVPLSVKIASSPTGEVAMHPGLHHRATRDVIFNHWRERLVKYYQKYNPEKVGEVSMLLSKYRGHEQELLYALERKYGPEFVNNHGEAEDVFDVKSSTHGSLALSYDGKVYQWGVLFEEILTRPTLIWSGLFSGRTPRLKAIAISCGRKHAALITENGGTFTWGCGFDGCLGHGSIETHHSRPTRVKALIDNRAFAISCGGNHTVAATDSGDVFVWGNNRNGQLGIYPREDRLCVSLPLMLILKEHAIIFVSCGRQHTALVSEKGYLLTMGCGKYGRLGHGPSALKEDDWEQGVNKSVNFKPRVVKYGSVRRPLLAYQVACGDFHTIVLGINGDVYSFGKNENGQCGHGTKHNYVVPRLIEALSGFTVSAVEAGGDASMAVLTNGTVFAWGDSSNGSLGIDVVHDMHDARDPVLDDVHTISLPCQITALSREHVVGVSCSGGHTIFVTSKTENEKFLNFDLTSLSTMPSTFTSLSRTANSGPADETGFEVEARLDLPTLFSRVRHGKYGDVLRELSLGVSPDTTDTHGNTLLLVACQNGRKKIAKCCLRYNANIDVQNRAGNSALHFCFMYGHLDLFDYLLEKGANDRLLNGDGKVCYEVGVSS